MSLLAPAGIIPTSIVHIEEVCRDKSALADKQKVMGGSFYTSMFYSMSDTFKFASAVLLPVALGLIIGDIKTAMDAAKATVGDAAVSNTVMDTIGLAISKVSATGWAFLGAAIATTGASIVTQFASSRLYHQNQFDQLEVNAQHTAKYLAQEIQKAHEFENPARADGKAWTQVVAQQSAIKNHTLGA